MSHEFDVIIAGLGAMGSATAYHVAKQGRTVLGLDRFAPPHHFGSSHGLTRIIREAYFEDPLYVPLVRRAYELWSELERESGRQLLVLTGGLMIGPPDGKLVRGARRSAEEHKLAHEILDEAQLAARFPFFRPADEMIGVWEPRAGILFPEQAVQTHLELAARRGAVLRYNEPVLTWDMEGDHVKVVTGAATYVAARLLLSGGAWMSSLLPGLCLPLVVERQVLCWFEPRSRNALFKRCPIYLCEYGPQQFFYGFPDLGDGVKAAIHHQGEITDPQTVRREANEADIDAVRALLNRFVPDAAGRLRSATVCLYTNTPDEHFILGQHPRYSQVIIASPCSGHGFKFSSVIGEVAATWLNGGVPLFDLCLFEPGRFGPKQGRSSARGEDVGLP
jgi:sarcosine oxidase